MAQPMLLLLLLAVAGSSDARLHPLQALAAVAQRLRSTSHAAAEGSALLPPPFLVGSTPTALSIAWDAADGADSYALYADSWWAGDGVLHMVYTGVRAWPSRAAWVDSTGEPRNTPSLQGRSATSRWGQGSCLTRPPTCSWLHSLSRCPSHKTFCSRPSHAPPAPMTHSRGRCSAPRCQICVGFFSRRTPPRPLLRDRATAGRERSWAAARRRRCEPQAPHAAETLRTPSSGSAPRRTSPTHRAAAGVLRTPQRHDA